MDSCFESQKSIKRPNKRNHTNPINKGGKKSDKIQYLFTINSKHLSANWDQRFLSLTKGVDTPQPPPLSGESHTAVSWGLTPVWRSWDRVGGGR